VCRSCVSESFGHDGAINAAGDAALDKDLSKLVASVVGVLYVVGKIAKKKKESFSGVSIIGVHAVKQ
jgi:hypothetical protein